MQYRDGSNESGQNIIWTKTGALVRQQLFGHGHGK